MAVKRLGSSSTVSKLDTIGTAVSSGLGDVSKQLETPLDRNRGAYERVPLDSVVPDPENPRNLKLTFDELREGISALQQGTAVETDRQRIYESISGLSATLKDVGQLQPITTYRDKRGQLRIVDGERRYWGARLLGWAHIDAKVKPSRPEYIRLEQYVANVQREDLTLGQHFHNLEMLLEEVEAQGRKVGSVSQLSALISRPRSTVQYWWAVLRGPEDVREALRKGSLQSLERAYTAAQEPDAGRRGALISGEVLVARGVPRAARKEGRPKTRVVLGAVKDVELVRTLILAVSRNEGLAKIDWKDFMEIDWSDVGVVQKTWQRFLEVLEATIRKSPTPGSSR